MGRIRGGIPHPSPLSRLRGRSDDYGPRRLANDLLEAFAGSADADAKIRSACRGIDFLLICTVES